MNTQINLDQCLAFVNCHLSPSSRSYLSPAESRYRAVTISRQVGSGAHVVGDCLAQHFRAKADKDSPPWTVFDRELVAKVLEEHRLPERMARFMPEDRISGISDTLDELFGLHPPSEVLVRKIAETVLHLVELGNVILIGHGGNVITSKLRNVFHVRLVAPFETRVRHIQQVKQLGQKESRAFVEREDLGRARFLKKYFGRDIEDPLHYHMVINTELTGHENAGRVIADAMALGRAQPARA